MTKRMDRQNGRHLPAARTGFLSGLMGALASAGALMALSQRGGGTMWQPLNATGHWLHGDRAGAVRKRDVVHTVPGAATHLASALFWGGLFGLWQSCRHDPGPVGLVRDAALLTGAAAVVDYALIPRRLRPGWELVLPPSGVAAGFAALGLGLAAGGLLARALCEEE